MDGEFDCLRCRARMELGFIPDSRDAGYVKPYWHPGAPESSFWTGLKLTPGKHAVVAHRCPQCGHVELFAPEEEPQ